MNLAEITSLAASTGLRGEQLATAVAIAGWQGSPHPAESGGNPAAVGDLGLVDGKWGPSIGLWQVRSLHADRGTRRERDQDALRDPAFNARAMYKISSGGSNWRPWSVYKNGIYERNMAQARAAAAAYGAGTLNQLTSSVEAPPASGSGGGWFSNPLEPIGIAARNMLNPSWWRRIGIGGVGVALVLAGVLMLMSPQVATVAKAAAAKGVPTDVGD